MTKKELRDKLNEGSHLEDLFDFSDGQECIIYKGNFEVSDKIIYIPDIDLNQIDTECALSNEDIENVIHNCYTGNDFVEECSGHEDLARELFDFVDWQHPNIQDLLDGYDDEEFEERYGFFKSGCKTPCVDFNNCNLAVDSIFVGHCGNQN